VASPVNSRGRNSRLVTVAWRLNSRSYCDPVIDAPLELSWSSMRMAITVPTRQKTTPAPM
jgi:hypothetical protein